MEYMFKFVYLIQLFHQYNKETNISKKEREHEGSVVEGKISVRNDRP